MLFKDIWLFPVASQEIIVLGHTQFTLAQVLERRFNLENGGRVLLTGVEFLSRFPYLMRGLIQQKILANFKCH